MKVKNDFKWERNFSAGGPIDIPAGAPVEWHEKNKCYYVNPEHFTGAIEKHDAVHYGCRVASENVDHSIPPENPTPVQWKEYGVSRIDTLIEKGYQFVVLFKEGDAPYGEPLAFKRTEDVSSFMWAYPKMKMIWTRSIGDHRDILTDRPYSTSVTYEKEDQDEG